MKNLLYIFLVIVFMVSISSCGKKTETNVADKKEPVKTETKTAEVKSIGEIKVFEAVNGADKQTVLLNQCIEVKDCKTDDFAGAYRRCETGYEKGTEKILSDLTGTPDKINFELKAGKLSGSVFYGAAIEISKIEAEGNGLTITFTKDGKETVIYGKLRSVDMKVKGWKENKMKVLIIESGKTKAIYFVGPENA
ncbi:MAG: hypothetical protein WCK13_07905 [Ignavibacteriota bacterium]|nr:hypothetical protein [Ignavibacteriota bacterium]